MYFRTEEEADSENRDLPGFAVGFSFCIGCCAGDQELPIPFTAQS